MSKYIIIICLLPLNCLLSQNSVDSLLGILPEKTGSEKVNVYLILAKELSRSNADTSLFYALKALETAEKHGSEDDIAHSYLQIAFSNYFAGKYDTAEENYFKALERYEKTGDKQKSAAVYNDLGIIYKNQSKYEKSLEYHLKALKLREEEGLQQEIAGSFNNIGNVYYILGNHEKALKNFKKALEIKEKTGEEERLASSYNNIGMVYYDIKNFHKALEYYKKSLDLDKRFENPHGVAQTYNNMANVYAETGNLKKAEEYALKAMTLDKKMKNHYSYAIDAINLGYTYNDMGNFNKALETIDIAVETSHRENYPALLKEAYLAKYMVYKNMDNPVNALEFHEKYHSLKDSLMNVQRMKQIEKLKIQYETENKNKQIELLKKEKEIMSKEQRIENIWRTVLLAAIILITLVAVVFFLQYRAIKKTKNLLEEKNRVVHEQKEQLENALEELEHSNKAIMEDARKLLILNERIAKSEKHLQDTNATKDKFFSIIAHDLKNPLTALLTSADLINLYFDRFDKESIKKNLARLSDIARKLSTLLDNLLQWSRAQTGHIEYLPEHIPLKDVISSCISVNRDFAIQKRIEVKSEYDGDIHVYADKNMINTILRNLLSNAIKFSNPGGTVTVDVKEKGKMAEISVSDSGIGINKENLDKLFKIDSQFSSRGTDNEKGTGLGLILCKEFIDYHNGRIWADSEPGEGSTFTFAMPVTTK